MIYKPQDATCMDRSSFSTCVVKYAYIYKCSEINISYLCVIVWQEKSYGERVMLIYDGLHYDALAVCHYLFFLFSALYLTHALYLTFLELEFKVKYFFIFFCFFGVCLDLQCMIIMTFSHCNKFLKFNFLFITISNNIVTPNYQSAKHYLLLLYKIM